MVNEHPDNATNSVTPETAKDLQLGAVYNVSYKDGKVFGELKITDLELANIIENGLKGEVSLMYLLLHSR